MVSFSLLAAPLYMLSTLAFTPPHLPGFSPRPLFPTSSIDDNNTPRTFYTLRPFPNFGFFLPWEGDGRDIPTWLRPVPFLSTSRVASLAHAIFASRPPKDRALPYSTYGPENFISKTNVSIDVRIIFRQYVQPAVGWSKNTPAGPMLNEQVTAAVAGIIEASWTQEFAVTMCFNNGTFITNCTGTIMLQRDLWYEGAKGRIF